MGIYLLECVGSRFVKIGWFKGSTEFEAISRIRELQTGNPFHLKIIRIVPNGTLKDEAEAHRNLSHLRIRGEWFDYTDAVNRVLDVLESERYQPDIVTDKPTAVGIPTTISERQRKAHGTGSIPTGPPSSEDIMREIIGQLEDDEWYKWQDLARNAPGNLSAKVWARNWAEDTGLIDTVAVGVHDALHCRVTKRGIAWLEAASSNVMPFSP